MPKGHSQPLCNGRLERDFQRSRHQASNLKCPRQAWGCMLCFGAMVVRILVMGCGLTSLLAVN